MNNKLFSYRFIGIVFGLFLATVLSKKLTVNEPDNAGEITLFMSGDVMLGRGIDQILLHPSKPVLYEPYIRNAIEYVKLAERRNGPIPYPVDCNYIWGDALAMLNQKSPDVRMINLETSITKSDDYWKWKGINYRMSPDNIDCLSAAKIDAVSLANNHVIDWGYSGLTETIETLDKAHIKHAGAGETRQQAETPVVMDIKGKGRVIVFSYGDVTSGVSQSWAATDTSPGVNKLADYSDNAVATIKAKIKAIKHPGDIVVMSLHWGGNWGYEIDLAHTSFAHKLIDDADVDVIHGHSSHHVKGMEVYKNKLIIYGCGDFLNDYEGISGKDNFRADLALMYFAGVDPTTGNLLRLHMTPTQIKHFKINTASTADTDWLATMLNREGQQFGTRVELNADSTLSLHWD